MQNQDLFEIGEMVDDAKEPDFAEDFGELERNGLAVEKLKTLIPGEAPNSLLQPFISTLSKKDRTHSVKFKKDSYNKKFAATTVEFDDGDKSYMNVRGEQRAIDESSLPGYMRGVSQKA